MDLRCTADSELRLLARRAGNVGGTPPRSSHWTTGRSRIAPRIAGVRRRTCPSPATVATPALAVGPSRGTGHAQYASFGDRIGLRVESFERKPWLGAAGAWHLGMCSGTPSTRLRGRRQLPDFPVSLANTPPYRLDRRSDATDETCAEPPSGTLTFLFTDIEGSTQHLMRLGRAYPDVLERHRKTIAAAIRANLGVVVDTSGDGCFAVFAEPGDALGAAVDAQRALSDAPWPDGVAIRVRMGLHTGEPMRVADGYTGLDVHRAARICAAGHGGQIVVTQATRRLIVPTRPSDVSIAGLGHFLLKGFPSPEPLFQVTATGLQDRFPPLRTARTDERQPSSTP
jgi:class 3 adenylate cyclase